MGLSVHNIADETGWKRTQLCPWRDCIFQGAIGFPKLDIALKSFLSPNSETPLPPNEKGVSRPQIFDAINHAKQGQLKSKSWCLRLRGVLFLSTLTVNITSAYSYFLSQPSPRLSTLFELFLSSTVPYRPLQLGSKN
jgi:hypothetical protein